MGGSYLLTQPRVPLWLTIAVTVAVVGVALALSPLILPNLYSVPQPCATC